MTSPSVAVCELAIQLYDVIDAARPHLAVGKHALATPSVRWRPNRLDCRQGNLGEGEGDYEGKCGPTVGVMVKLVIKFEKRLHL